MGKENKGSFIISVLAAFFKQESFKEGIYTSFFATVGLGIFYYLDMKGLSLIFTIPLIMLIYGLTILVILGLERMSIHENNWAQLFLIIGFVFYDVPASLGYLSYFANNDIALIFNLPFEFTVFITVFISIILFIIMYYYRNSTYFVKFKYYYTSSLILLIPLLGTGDKIQITEIDWIGLTLFAMVGFTPIFNKLREKKYLNSPDERKEFIYGAIMGFLVITVIIILYILIGHFNLVLNINPKIGKPLVGINGLIAYLAFSTSFANSIYPYIKKHIIVTILITILIDIILGAIILVWRLPVHRYLVVSGLFGGSFQYIIPIIYIPIIYILNKVKKKK